MIVNSLRYTFYILIFSSFLLKGQHSEEVEDELFRHYSLAFDYLVVDADSSLHYAKQYLEYSKSINDSLEMATALDLIGAAYYYQNKIKPALENHIAAHKIFKRHNDYSGLSVTHLSLGNVYNDQGYYLRAIDHYLKSIEYDKMIDYPEGEATTTLNIAMIFQAQENYNLAMDYIDRSIQLSKEFELEQTMASAFNLKAELLLQQGEIDHADSLSRIALDIAEEFQDQFSLASAHCNLGMVASKRGEHDKAIELCGKAVEVMQDYGDPYSISLYKTHLARILFAGNFHEQSLLQAQESYDLAKEQNSRYLTRESALILSKACEKAGQFEKALQLYREYKAYNDTLIKLNIQERLLQQKNELRQKENEMLSSRNKLQDKVIARNKLLLIIVTVFLVASIAFILTLILNIRKRKEYNRLLMEKTDMIQKKQKEIDYQSKLLIKKNLELENLNHTKNKLFSILTHDLKQPFNQLLGILELLEYDHIDKEDKDELLMGLKDSVSHTRSSVENLLIWSKNQFTGMSVNLQEVPFVRIFDTLKKQLESALQQKSLELEIEVDRSLKSYSDPDQTEIIFRNLLVNAIKFSLTGQKIHIGSSTTEKNVTITVRDQGAGMTQEQIDKMLDLNENLSTPGTLNEKGTGLGLLIVQEFLEANHGTLNIESAKGQGSCFSVTLPLAK